MAKSRVTVPIRTQKRIFQEANSSCAFCAQSEVATLQIHHIDENPTNNDLGNLLLVCANCHTKITAKIISYSEVVNKKNELQERSNKISVSPPAVVVSITKSSFKGDIAQNITKITSPKAPRIVHPPGSLGADLEKRSYIDYLIKRYWDYRKADASHGRRTKGFSHGVLHSNIQRRFGYKTFFMPVAMFPHLSDYLKSMIDNTILGRRNCANGNNNYHIYEEHLSKHQYNMTDE